MIKIVLLKTNKNTVEKTNKYKRNFKSNEIHEKNLILASFHVHLMGIIKCQGKKMRNFGAVFKICLFF